MQPLVQHTHTILLHYFSIFSPLYALCKFFLENTYHVEDISDVFQYDVKSCCTCTLVHTRFANVCFESFFYLAKKKNSEDKHMDSIRNEVDIKVHHDVMITSR